MTDWQRHNRGPITEDRLVRAVAVLAEIVKQHGPAYGPLYDSVEQELAAFRQRHQSLEASAESLRRKRSRKVA